MNVPLQILVHQLNKQMKYLAKSFLSLATIITRKLFFFKFIRTFKSHQQWHTAVENTESQYSWNMANTSKMIGKLFGLPIPHQEISE